MRYHEGLAIFSNTDIYWHSMMILWFPQCFLLKLSSLYVPILFQLCSIHISPMPCTYSRPCGINKLWTMAPWGQQWHGEVEMSKISTGCLACIDLFLCLINNKILLFVSIITSFWIWTWFRYYSIDLYCYMDTIFFCLPSAFCNQPILFSIKSPRRDVSILMVTLTWASRLLA